MRQVTPRNTDRVTSKVLIRAGIGALISILAAWGIDLNISEDSQGALADALLVIVPIVGTLAGGLWGSRDAREHVTPIGANDVPRDVDGTELVRVDGKPLTARAVAREELQRNLAPPELDERLTDEPRIDRRGVDRDPDRPR